MHAKNILNFVILKTLGPFADTIICTLFITLKNFALKIKVGENKLTRLLQSYRCPAQRSNERDLREDLECRRRNSNNLPIT